MLWNVIIMSFIVCLTSLITALINGHLLSATFISKTRKKYDELGPFYLRFLIDFCFGITGGINHLTMCIFYLGYQNFLTSNEYLKFSIIWPMVSFSAARAVLVVIITTDRTLAVYTPFWYKKNRRKVGIYWILLPIVGYFVLSNMVLFLICSYQLSVPIDCVAFRCAINSCYLTFALNYDLVMYVIISLISVILISKLYIWNNCSKSGRKSDYLSKANRLAVIDLIMILIFDLLPTSIKIINPGPFEERGPTQSLFKSIGYLIESILVIRALIRKTENITTAGSKTSKSIDKPK